MYLMMMRKETKMSSIFTVISNTRDAGNESIMGMYPTRKLAEARVNFLMSNPDNVSEDNDFSACVVEVKVGPNGADTMIELR
jgi:hypothetical protein